MGKSTQSGAVSQSEGDAIIQAMSPEEFARVLAFQPNDATRNALNIARTRSTGAPRASASGTQQAPKRASTLTPEQRANAVARQAEIDKATAASVQRQIDDVTRQNLVREAEGRKPLRVPEPFTSRPAGVPGDSRVHGIPVAPPPTFFQQDFAGPRPPTQDRPLPPTVSAPAIEGIPGQTEDITGAEKARILSEAGVRPLPVIRPPESTDEPPVELKTTEARVQVPGQEPPLSNMVATSQPLIRPAEKTRGNHLDTGVELGAKTPGGVTTTGSRPLPWRA